MFFSGPHQSPGNNICINQDQFKVHLEQVYHIWKLSLNLDWFFDKRTSGNQLLYGLTIKALLKFFRSVPWLQFFLQALTALRVGDRIPKTGLHVVVHPPHFHNPSILPSSLSSLLIILHIISFAIYLSDKLGSLTFLRA